MGTCCSAPGTESRSKRKKTSSKSAGGDKKGNGEAKSKNPKKKKKQNETQVVDFAALWSQPPPPSILKNGSSAGSSLRRDPDAVAMEAAGSGSVNPLSPFAGDVMRNHSAEGNREITYFGAAVTPGSTVPRTRKVTMTPDVADARSAQSRQPPLDASDVPSAVPFTKDTESELTAALRSQVLAETEPSMDSPPPVIRRSTAAGDSTEDAALASNHHQASRTRVSPPAVLAASSSLPAPVVASITAAFMHSPAEFLSGSGRRSDGGEKMSRLDDTTPPSELANLLALADPAKPIAKAPRNDPPVDAVKSPPPRPPTMPAVADRQAASLRKTAANRGAGPHVTIQGRVYNLEKLMRSHPGGPGVLRQYDGRDATEAFFGSHSPAPVAALAKYAVPEEL